MTGSISLGSTKEATGRLATTSSPQEMCMMDNSLDKPQRVSQQIWVLGKEPMMGRENTSGVQIIILKESLRMEK